MNCGADQGRTIGPRLKYLNHALVRKFTETAREMGVEERSIIHGRILAYLYGRRGEAVFQKDLEEQFNVTRSAVAGIVKRMEQRGDILRESVDSDARLKRLRLTPRAEASCRRTMEAMDRVEDLAVRGLTPEQLDQFFAVCDVIRENLTGRRGQDHGNAPDHRVTDQGV